LKKTLVPTTKKKMALVTTIDIVNDIDKCIKEYVVFDPNSLQSSVVRLDITATQFGFKPMMS